MKKLNSWLYCQRSLSDWNNAGQEERDWLIRYGRWYISMQLWRNMNGKNGRFICPAFSFCDILRPFAK
ncbi:hypothetical protein RBV54_000504 [Salmonella enterica]|nr:hypothetical protein [Salmonella enterica]ELF7042451.1 hypothetical protein [Salmonella enterica]